MYKIFDINLPHIEFHFVESTSQLYHSIDLSLSSASFYLDVLFYDWQRLNEGNQCGELFTWIHLWVYFMNRVIFCTLTLCALSSKLPHGLEHRFPFCVNPLHALTGAHMSLSVSITLVHPSKKTGLLALKYSLWHLNVKVEENVIFENVKDFIASELGNTMSVGTSWTFISSSQCLMWMAVVKWHDQHQGV